ncbi:MAG: Smr/MutS family protein [Muribaculaceae bacterium]|nr:Smr/MutS family protein [Muribaculaceae bacterium]
MIYPDRIEEKLGFSPVRASLTARCLSALGAGLVEQMAFMTAHASVSRALEATAEMKAILESDDTLPIEQLRDATPLLNAIRPEGTFMPPADLLTLRSMLAVMADIDRYFARYRSDEDGATPYPVLDSEARLLVPFPALLATIDRVIDRYGNVKDNASPELATIRASLRSTAGTVNSIMRRVLARAVADGLVDHDTTPSVRDGRLVLPVAPMNKRRVNGIVHDESASGKTVFIEPAEVVEANNRIRELEIEERREIARIMMAVAADIRPNISAILDSASVLAFFDFTRAKALYAIETKGALPVVAAGPDLEWYHACHPVLKLSLERQGKEIVPLDITLTPSARLLVISGPNAGGKSVCLKTVGTLQYMLQMGMLPPVHDNSRFGIFDDIFIDIGDDQSIEDDLSTYSSHLRNMKLMLRQGRGTSLVLIDEFGGGTEPQIGGAIAQAILGQFNELKMWGVITTHYQNLKHFAEDTEGLINGSMLYDRHLMQPMFKLSIGNPGSSFAVEIARKIGLPEAIISRAEEIVGSDYINLDRYLLDIARDKRYWENKRNSIRLKEKKVDQALEKYQTEADTLRRDRRAIIDEARREAESIIARSNATVERTIHDIRRHQADKEKTLEARRRLNEEKERLAAEAGKETASGNALLDKAPRAKKKKNAPSSAISVKKAPIEPGLHVRLDGQGTVGTVVEVNGNKAVVTFGMLKTTVETARLVPTIAKPQTGAKKASFLSAQTTDSMRDRQLSFKQQIDVRGMRVDEAIQAITYFIDDALQFETPRVRILHGTGTGALRQSIRQYLASVPGVKSYADEDVRLGGAGITVVNLD